MTHSESAQPMKPTQSAQPDFDALMCAVQSGEKQAFSDLVTAAQIPLRSFLAIRLIRLDLLDDVEQATWVTCYQQRGKYQPGGNALSWIMGIARNLAHEHMRKQFRHQQQDDDVLAALFEHSLSGSRSELSAPDKALIKSELQDQVQACLAELSPTSRKLIDARYFADRSVADIASELERSNNWVSVTLMRIRKSLSSCLQLKGINLGGAN